MVQNDGTLYRFVILLMFIVHIICVICQEETETETEKEKEVISLTLYEIDQRILNTVDSETGEIIDLDALNSLQLERNRKIENVACWIKNLRADVEAIKNEERNLKERRDAAENKVESLKKWLNRALDGEKFSTGKCDVSFRKSTSLNCDEAAFIEWAEHNDRDDLLTFREPTVSKRAITDAIHNGETFPFCELQEKRNVNIK